MEISEEREGPVVIVAPQGRLDSNTSPELEARLLALLAETQSGVVIDFSHLVYVSSAGLRVLLMAAKRVKAGGGALALCAMNDNIREVFKISGFDRVFNIVPTRDDALSALS